MPGSCSYGVVDRLVDSVGLDGENLPLPGPALRADLSVAVRRESHQLGADGLSRKFGGLLGDVLSPDWLVLVDELLHGLFRLDDCLTELPERFGQIVIGENLLDVDAEVLCELGHQREGHSHTVLFTNLFILLFVSHLSEPPAVLPENQPRPSDESCERTCCTPGRRSTF